MGLRLTKQNLSTCSEIDSEENDSISDASARQDGLLNKINSLFFGGLCFTLLFLLELLAKDWFLSLKEPFPYIEECVVTSSFLGAFIVLDSVRFSVSFLLRAVFYFVLLLICCYEFYSLRLSVAIAAALIILALRIIFYLYLSNYSKSIIRRVFQVILGIIFSIIAALSLRIIIPSFSFIERFSQWFGAGLGTSNSTIFTQKLLAEWGKVTVVVIISTILLALCCVYLLFLRINNVHNREERLTVACIGIGLLFTLLWISMSTPAFLTIETGYGTMTLAGAIAALGLSASPAVRPSIQYSRRFSDIRRGFGLVGFLFVTIAFCLFMIHIRISPYVHRVAMNAFRKNQATWISINSISQETQDACVAGEDGNFWHHSGFDWLAVHRSLRMLLQDRKDDQQYGTITQQLAEHLFISNKRTFSVKLYEGFYTFELEHNFSKKQILELYLNLEDYGMETQGIRTASLYYFHKSPAQLTLSESACLAGFLSYNPQSKINLQQVAQSEQTTFFHMTRYFPTRYSQDKICDAMAVPLESFVYPFKSSRDQKFTDINPDMSKDKFGAWKAGDNILESFPMSCGPAALSTILTYYLKRPTTEREIMRIAGTNGDSYTNFEQLARAAAFFNIRTKIVQLNTARLLQQLTKSNTPIIALIYVPQGHFVDVIGREGENLLISDPYSGNRIITVSEFTKVWFGSALIIEK